MEIKLGDKVRFLEYGVIKTAEVLSARGNRLLLMINDRQMCLQTRYKVEKIG